MSGHGVIINQTSKLPFVFEFNPVSLNSVKNINYVIAPNIGGSHKKRYFAGFDSEEVNFTLHCIDKESITGVNNQLSYFKQLRKPDPGLFGIASSFFGNENYPPPQILFQWGTSSMPLVWDVLDVKITSTHFFDDPIRGVTGIPYIAQINIKLALVEDHVLNKANQIAEKSAYMAASLESVLKDKMQSAGGGRRESWVVPKLGTQVKNVL